MSRPERGRPICAGAAACVTAPLAWLASLAILALLGGPPSAGAAEVAKGGVPFTLALRSSAGAGIFPTGRADPSVARSIPPFSHIPPATCRPPIGVWEAAPSSGARAGGSAVLILPGLSDGLSPASEEAGGQGRKQPWLAGAEVVGSNLVLWVYSRYIAKEDWAYINWQTVKANFRNGFQYDDDMFFTNFFMHPYHGSLYYNAARSLNMSFLESSLYTLGGSLMWELFMENQYPSTNDLLTTVAGGVYVGEFFHRISSLILDETAAGGRRTWRRILAFLINPMRGVNRLAFGEKVGAGGIDQRVRAPLEGHVALTGNFVIGSAGSSWKGAGTALELDFLYGERFSSGARRAPFDLILFDLRVRSTESRVHLDIESHALLWGLERRNGKGRGHLLGLFQHFDYLDNELFVFGGTSLAGGVVSFFPLGANRRLELRTSAQLGASIISAADNIHYPEASSEFHYGMGPMAKFEAHLAHERWGWLCLRLGHLRHYAIQGVNSADRASYDFFSILKAQYGVAVRRGVGFRVEYASYSRRNSFEGFERTALSLSHLGLSLILSFS